MTTERCVKLSRVLWKDRRGVKYAIGERMPRRWWWDVWLPTEHDGRGRCVSIGLWVVAVYRGYCGGDGDE